MSTRDELIADLSRPEHAPMADHDPRDGSCRSCPVPVWSLGAADIADALIAEGWRKMPSPVEVSNAIAELPTDVAPADVARAILALMDGGSA